ncbi:hypothetical protein ACFL6I_20825, partial [candidate division KSB1 bacterium]
IYYVSDTLYSLTAEEVIELPNQNFTNLDTLLYPPLPVGHTDSIIITKPYSFDPDTANQRLDSIFLKAGNMDINLSSYINHTFQIEVRIPNLTKNGQSLVISLPHNYSGSLPVNINQTIDLTDYLLILDNSPGNVNKLFITYVLYVVGDNDPINNPYTLNLTADLYDLQFSKLFGFIGQYGFPLTDSIDLAVFTSSLEGSIMIHEIKTFLNTHNSFGMPMSVDILNFTTLVSSSATPVNILNPGTIIPMPSPTIAQMGQFIDTTYQFDENNSGIVNAINTLPSSVLFDINGISNPANDTSKLNFILDTSRFTVDASFELPLYTSISGFVLEDTLDWKLDNIKELESALVTVICDNGFPLSVDVKVFFTNDYFFKIDSLSNNPIIIESGIVGPAPDLKVISPSHNKFEIILDKDKLTKIADATKMVFRASISSYQAGDIKVYSTDYFNFQIGVKTKIDLSY